SRVGKHRYVCIQQALVFAGMAVSTPSHRQQPTRLASGNPAGGRLWRRSSLAECGSRLAPAPGRRISSHGLQQSREQPTPAWNSVMTDDEREIRIELAACYRLMAHYGVD